jgi:hypothetical protein
MDKPGRPLLPFCVLFGTLRAGVLEFELELVQGLDLVMALG